MTVADWVSSGIALVAVAINLAFLLILIKQVALLRDQVTQAREAFSSERHRAQQQSTLEFLAATLQRRHDLAQETPWETETEAVQEFLGAVGADPSKRQHLSNYLNYYENLAAGINAGVYDIDIVARTSGRILVRIEQTYRKYIKDLRESVGNPRAYLEIEQLASKLRLRLAEADVTDASRDNVRVR